MKKILALLASLVLMGVAVGACSPASPLKMARSNVGRDMKPAVPASKMLDLTDGNNAFALAIYNSLRSQPGNFVYSPYSISAALAMTYAGARGETEAQMAHALHFDLPQEYLHLAFDQLDLSLKRSERAVSTEEQPLTLRIANGIWIDQNVQLVQAYLDVLARNYDAGIHLADFINAYEPARREINSWVKAQTEKRIDNLIPEGAIDNSTRMILVNAIYFNAHWQDPFDAADTKNEPFQLLDGSSVSVAMMHADISNAAYFAGRGFEAVELTYEGGTAAMDILVPDQGTFSAWEQTFDAGQFDEIVNAMQPGSVNLALPKFSFSSAFNLGDQLAALGMPDAFNPDLADFSGMTGGRDLFIDKVLHQAFVTVDEKGTEAAAATAVIMAPTSMMRADHTLRVDRPFILVIRDLATRQVLFVGRVLNPAP